MRLRQQHWMVLFAVFSQLALGCGSSSDAALNSGAGGPGAAGNGQGSGGNAATGGAPSHAGSANGAGGGMPGTHTTGLVKLNLKVK